MTDDLLSASDLRLTFGTGAHRVAALRGVSLTLGAAEAIEQTHASNTIAAENFGEFTDCSNSGRCIDQKQNRSGQHHGLPQGVARGTANLAVNQEFFYKRHY